MTDLAEDAVSLTSSCEIVDALEEAVNDVAPVIDASKDSSPTGEVSWTDNPSMTASQYAQVIFNDIKDSYPLDLDLKLSYTLTPFIQSGHGDRICLYKLPYLQPHEYVAYVWTNVSEDKTLSAKFSVSVLPKEEDFYQFQYLKGDNQVVGASVPFQLRLPGKSHQEVTGVKEEDDLLVVQTSQTSLQEKYTSLLDLSEKLTEELNKKNESFIILEQNNQSLVETSTKVQEMESDLSSLTRDKIQLEQTLTQTTETLTRSESLLDTTTEKLMSVEKSLKEKVDIITELEVKLGSIELKNVAVTEDVRIVTKERDSLAAMLEQEIAARENLLKEKQELVNRLEDTNNMLAAAATSKDLAVAEIRAQIEAQDRMRVELAKFREEAGHAEAELVLVKQQLARFTGDSEDAHVVTAVLSSLGEKLEEKERELKKKNEEISLLKQLEESKNHIEIHEKCLEDADTRAETLEKTNRNIVREKEELKKQNMALIKANAELTARLEAGATHFRKLAAEKQTLEKKTPPNAEIYITKIDSLEAKISQLSEELRQARTAQDIQLSEIKCAVSSQVSSSGGSSFGEREMSLDMVSDTGSNMDSVKINRAIDSGLQVTDEATRDVPRVKMPTASLFRPLGLHNGAGAALPSPLIPEVVAPASVIPELTPRLPAPYSSGPQTRHEVKTILNCPLCEATFPQDSLEQLQAHVNNHIDTDTRSCPMCEARFGVEAPQSEYEAHVQDHFRDQSLSIRGWDLGID